LVDNDSQVTDSARRLDAGVRQLKQVDSALRYTIMLRQDNASQARLGFKAIQVQCTPERQVGPH